MDATQRARARGAAVISAVALVLATTAAGAQPPSTIATAGVPGVGAATTVRIPMTEAGGRQLTLEATLYRPAGDGRTPVLVFNHGSTGGGSVTATTTLTAGRLAPFFVERGIAVLAPMRRGRGASEGAHNEAEATCKAEHLAPGIARAVEDVDAAMGYVRAQPWADADRVLIGGQSRGGLLSVVYATRRPGSVQAVINFAGGWTSERCDNDVDGRFNESAFAAAGRGQARVPAIWLYAEQDRFYGPAAIRRYHAAFTHAGGAASFQLFPAFGGDGHRLVDRVELWRAAVDDFLHRLDRAPR